MEVFMIVWLQHPGVFSCPTYHQQRGPCCHLPGKMNPVPESHSEDRLARVTSDTNCLSLCTSQRVQSGTGGC